MQLSQREKLEKTLIQLIEDVNENLNYILLKTKQNKI